MDTILEFKDSSIFHKDHLVLSNVSFEIKKGEFVYLIGKVGSGKSSLIKTINAELPMRLGYGFVSGYNLTTLKKRQIPLLRRKLGIVFQDFQLLIDRSVYDNLYFVLKATGWKNKALINQRIDEVLTMVDLTTSGYKFPHQISGGEQQRIVIARALLNNPELILADEPTGNLDPETTANIMEILMDIRKTGRAVLMATHNYNLLKKFPERTLKCENNRVIETSQTSEIDFSELNSEEENN